MRSSNSLPGYLFFTGKGGVGKTSIACATAVQLADAGQRVLLVSTDPASNVGQVFGVTIGNRDHADPGRARLARGARDRSARPPRRPIAIASSVPCAVCCRTTVVKGIEEQLSGACTTEIAAFDEFTDAAHRRGPSPPTTTTSLFDTAPTGHTIRLLQLPGAWSGFLDEGKGDASCLGPLAGLEKQRAQYKAAVDALAEPRAAPADSRRTCPALDARARSPARTRN